jgi:hypothetical protein
MLTLKEFFENHPPSSVIEIKDMPTKDGVSYLSYNNLPKLDLFCESEKCNGLRIYETNTNISFKVNGEADKFIEYTCCNCKQSVKTYAVFVHHKATENKIFFYKYGELAPFGPRTPSRLITLIGPDKELFLKGRRAESQGFGIGAFAYYRRVVENQKNRIIDELIKVLKKLEASEILLKELETAKTETQFTRAIENIKTGLPTNLLIDGHNPLTLIHAALSDGLHDKSDEHCLELAKSIRLVLAELSERISNILKDNAELTEAVKRLFIKKAK